MGQTKHYLIPTQDEACSLLFKKIKTEKIIKPNDVPFELSNNLTSEEYKKLIGLIARELELNWVFRKIRVYSSSLISLSILFPSYLVVNKNIGLMSEIKFESFLNNLNYNYLNKKISFSKKNETVGSGLNSYVSKRICISYMIDSSAENIEATLPSDNGECQIFINTETPQSGLNNYGNPNDPGEKAPLIDIQISKSPN
ncbi:hypothetical protein DICPUDRAFT_82198 [Dictyostelium purpureum]|uniref:Uncharacterized protein n=1 Tax=Dictyostelium purpureum TaxID=5786 RepID=F0ZVT6_DICPU|nr:uncharacterized protein DICPUDRAFT_82198 [Dictyostelium purpureum]EGC31928.1 hypothetical protein DICPUDRAFT_82198 [Dictyostelium purpureum]|eukprot:XP_003291530.1 hypothetical protein DICPUDRAFT_82198 [Dictyostelium purpureum]